MSAKKSRWTRYEEGSGQAEFYSSDGGTSLLLTMGKRGSFSIEGMLDITPLDREKNPYAMTVADRLEELAATIKDAAKHARELGK